MRPPDEVDDDIDAFPVRSLLHLLGKVLRLVVYRVRGTLGKAEQPVELLPGRGRGRDGVSEVDDQGGEACQGGVTERTPRRTALAGWQRCPLRTLPHERERHRPSLLHPEALRPEKL